MYPLKKSPLRKFFNFLCVTVLSCSIVSCTGNMFEVPSPEEFTKDNRERLGEIIQSSILKNNQFQLIPNLPPYDTTLYWYLQTLYDQATLSIRLDNQSPSSNRWNQDREWEVFVIRNDAEKMAFTIPGGNFFISTGFLKLFKEDFELYYVLLFEAILMNDRHLLTKLIEMYNSLTLINIIQGKATANEISTKIIAEELPELIFSDDLVQEIDLKTVRGICESSVFERQGIVPLLNNYTKFQVDWLRTRETYSSRAEDIPFYSVENGLVCGEIRNTGKYQKFVLDMLP